MNRPAHWKHLDLRANADGTVTIVLERFQTTVGDLAAEAAGWPAGTSTKNLKPKRAIEVGELIDKWLSLQAGIKEKGRSK